MERREDEWREGEWRACLLRENNMREVGHGMSTVGYGENGEEGRLGA